MVSYLASNGEYSSLLSDGKYTRSWEDRRVCDWVSKEVCGGAMHIHVQ